MPSVFLARPRTDWVASNELAFALRDAFPVSPGHTLVIPKRLVATWFDATLEEQHALMALVEEVKRDLDRELQPSGYNVGFNAGTAAGQTVMHLHVHVIPRFEGDMDDPTGGVRHVIPHRGNYRRAQVQPLARGGLEDPFLRHLLPLFATAREIAIVAAFVQDSGLDLLRTPLLSALERGTAVRLLTGDYLAITQVEALQRLLDWSTLETSQREDEGPRGTFEARVLEGARLPTGVRSFHPKSWRFEGPGYAVAFVGSSNISLAALRTGIEWNLRLERDRDPVAWRQLVEGFDALWQRGQPLSPEWIAAYAQRARREPLALPPGEVEPDARPPPEPHDIQQDALEQLAATRRENRTRALVVLATGLGKTWLAVWDVAAFARELGRWPRVLFLAHRAEILGQAAETFHLLCRREHPLVRTSWFLGEHSDLGGEVVLASVQKLARREHLEKLAPDAFDYVIVDEVHHAAADSYRRILERLTPRFLLGLTATPDRADQGDVLGLFDDHLAYRADLGEGIAAGKLVPFAYFGLKDQVDYRPEHIPWRNGRFDPEALERHVATEQRMDQLWGAWQNHPGQRSLVFCCTIRHAVYVRDWLRGRGVRVEAVFSQPGSADRAAALRDLAEGGLDAIVAVDLFNEGVDVPELDRVVMLRPTESPVVFIQQLGRGLRLSDGKELLTIIDFVGNHRVFLQRVRTLLSLAGSEAGLEAFLRRGAPLTDLPEGCSVELELEALDLLERLLPRGQSQLQRVYRELAATRERRPTAGELYRMGYLPKVVYPAFRTWFDFVKAEGDRARTHPDEGLIQAGLSQAEQQVLEVARAWFRELETTQMTKSYKMVTLEALLEAEALSGGLPVAELARRSHALLARSPELFRDVERVRDFEDARHPEPEAWEAYWRRNPIAAWTNQGTGRRRVWFALEHERFVPRLPIPEGHEDVFAAMTRELVDYRVAQYRDRQRAETDAGAFECRVTWNQRDPIIQLPKGLRGLGETDVRLEDGTVWQFRFMREFCNVARPIGDQRNRLPDLLRGWFGPDAGKPGTNFRVRFSRSPDGWWVEPVGAQVIPFPSRGEVVAYPTLRAAAGAPDDASTEAPEAELVSLPVEHPSADLFAVRAHGDSMDGGKRPIRDGDWMILRWARGLGIGAVENRVALVQHLDEEGAWAYQVKRVVREGRGWMLRSNNPARPSWPADERTTVLATLASVVRPEDLAPAPGTVLSEPELAEAFSLAEAPSGTERVGGHLFLALDAGSAWKAPDRVSVQIADLRPGETAYVLVRDLEDRSWRYCGVGRLQEDGTWAFPALDHATWQRMGGGRKCSRTLPPSALERAKALAERILAEPGRVYGLPERQCRVVGPAARGGIRIAGVDGRFAERTVSLTDLAWVLLAQEDARRSGGLLDEARVNRLRYIDGTPRASTRWIDTQWALILTESTTP